MAKYNTKGRSGSRGVVMQRRSKVKRHFKTLEHLSTLPEPTAQCVIESGSDDLVHAIGELVKNMLNGNIPVDTHTVRKLKEHTKNIRQLSKKKTSCKRKKKIISQTGSGFFIPQLISMAIPLIKGLFGL